MTECFEFTPHSQKQEDAIFSEAKLTFCITGIQWGKSTVGAVWLKRWMHTHTAERDNFLVTAPTYKIMNQATLPAFMDVMRDYGEYSASRAEFKMWGGGTCFFRTGTEPDSVVGITNVRAVWADEVGKYTLYFWDNIQGRASFLDAPIMGTTSPYSLNWIYRDYIRRKQAHVAMYRAKSCENPYFSKAEYERRKATMDPRRFAMMYDGAFEKMQGLVYDCFDEDLHIIEPAEFAPGTVFYGGIDWGFTEPFHLAVRAVTPSGNHYKVAEVHKSGLTVKSIIDICKQKKQTWGIRTFFCGPDQPGHILALNQNGCPAVPAENNKRLGIDLHYELIRSGRYFIFKDACPYTLDEMSQYHYPEPEDLGNDDRAKDQLPVEKDDHACFVAGTMIRTPHGLIEIERVQLGMLVDGPFGPTRVVWAGCTGYEEVITFDIEGGGTIECTPDHPMAVAFEGFRRLDSERYSVIVHAWNPKQSSLMARNIIGMVTTSVRAAAARMTESAFTSLFGSTITVSFRKDTRSITSTSIARTTIFRTSNASRRRSTRHVIEGDFPRRRKSISTQYERRLLSGTHQQKGKNGTRSMQSGRCAPANCIRTFVESVRSLLRVRVLRQSFVRTIAGLILDANLASTISRSDALSVVRNLKRTDTLPWRRVRRSAQSSCSKKLAAVYALSVRSGCYFANDILVSNCDAERYLTVSTVSGGKLRKPKVRDERMPHQDEDVFSRHDRLRSRKKNDMEVWQ